MGVELYKGSKLVAVSSGLRRNILRNFAQRIHSHGVFTLDGNAVARELLQHGRSNWLVKRAKNIVLDACICVFPHAGMVVQISYRL